MTDANTQTDAIDPKLEAMAEQGVVDNTTYDHDQVKEVQEAEANAPKPYAIKVNRKNEKGEDEEVEVIVRDITLRVPTDVSDATVSAAWQMGMAAVNNAQRGVMTILFPHAKQTEDGKMTPTLARKDCILAKPEDVNRILKLADTITHVNVQVASAMATNPADAIAVAQQGTKLKDNMTADLTAKAKGGQAAKGIILAG